MRMSWTLPLSQNTDTLAALRALPRHEFAAGAVLFQAGGQASGFVVVLSGRIEVRLTALSGREILLYAVEPGQSCVQTTLGLLGDEPYSGEAVCATGCTIVLIPKPMFLNMMGEDASFRAAVLRAFGRRMADLTHVLEQVAFVPIEPRLAQALLELADAGVVVATQAEIAARIGSAREVITRKLDGFAAKGWIARERGRITVLNEAALRRVAAAV
jgi:CRP/FNR family transcriptional regulator